MRRWAEFVLRFRGPIVAAALGATAFLGYRASRLALVWDEQAELPADNAEMARFERFRERFGGPEYLLVVLRTADVFAPDFLEGLRALTEELRAVPRAVAAVSLATVPVVRGTADAPRIEPFLPAGPIDRGTAERLRAEAREHPLWVGNLVSADGRTACIDVMLPAMNPDLRARLDSVAAARAAIARHPLPGAEAFCTGLSPLASDTFAALESDVRRFACLTPPLILACLFWAFRTRRGVLAPALAIAAAVVWSLGALELGGGALNLCTSMLPTLVAVNGLSYAIHLVNAYHEACAGGGEHREVLARTTAHAAPALFLAALTTAVGFGTQAFSDLRSLRQLGLSAAAGVLISFVLCATLLPALLSYLPPPAAAAHRHRARRWLRGRLRRASDLANRDRWKIPAALAVLLAAALAGLGRIRVESQWARYLPETMPSIQGLRAVERDLAGFYVLELELAGAPGTFREPWALREIDRIQRAAAGLEGVDRATSANDFLREMRRARRPDARAGDGLPETAGELAEYRLLYSLAGSGDVLGSFLTADGSAARISVRIRTMTTADHLRLIEDLERFAERELDPRLELRTTGIVKLFAVHLHALIRGLWRSFGLSFLCIAALLSFQLRSLRAGCAAMIPNALPIALGFGLMGVLGIALGPATVMIAPVGLGIAVDDTIHLMLRYRRELRAGHAPAGAVRRTLLGTGRAMVYSSLGLAAGFSVLAFSRFQPNREFGLLTAFILLAALLADLFATPYLVRTLGLFRKEAA